MTNKDKQFLSFLKGWMYGIDNSIEPNPRQDTLLGVVYYTFEDCVEGNTLDKFLLYLDGFRRIVDAYPQSDEDNLDEILKDIEARFNCLYYEEE